MRIAQIAPLFESVPPKLYGGTERIVAYLTDELVRRGHDITLFASGDSRTTARLVAPCDRALRLGDGCDQHDVYHVLLMEEVVDMAREFDVMHSHIDYRAYPLLSRCDVPHLSTLHGRLDLPDLVPLYQRFRDIPVVSISNAQRAPLPWLNWQRTVYHGLPRDLFECRSERGDYLAFIGRISPEKRVDRAIEIAGRAGMPLKVAAKVDDADQKYYEDHIEPLLDQAHVEYVGEVGGEEKETFLQNAHALLFPIDWPEPFGLVMIEAFACGTPVIAWANGAVPEVMRDGVSGYVVESIDEAVEAVQRVEQLSRADCRRYFEEHFSVEAMVDAYLEVYRDAVQNAAERPPKERRMSGHQPLRMAVGGA